MTQKILFVDDSLQLLSAIRRRLRKEIDLTTAESGQEALSILKKEGPFSVMVTDQNMPGMDGVELLEQANIIDPDMIRIMMTGQADQDTTFDAINKGHIFKILSKPCSPDDVLASVKSAQQEFETQNSEKLLLEQTLASSVKLLVDVVALQNGEVAKAPPYARGWARKLAPFFPGINRWEIDLSVMLSALGNITLPVELQNKISVGQELDASEQKLLEQTPAAARDLLSNIPKLDTIADAIYMQNKGYDGSGFPEDGPKGKDIPLLARVLRIVNDLCKHCFDDNGNLSLPKAFSDLHRNNHLYDAEILHVCKTALVDDKDICGDLTELKEMAVTVSELAEGDLLEGDVRTVHGSLILASDQILTAPMIWKISQTHSDIGVTSPIQVLRRSAA